MPLNITIEQTSGIDTIEVPADVAADLQATYEALKDLPNNRQAVVEFATDKEARLFCKQGQSWAAATVIDGQPLTFSRRGNVKENPTRVSFRVYRANTEAEKAAKKAEAEKASKKASK